MMLLEDFENSGLILEREGLISNRRRVLEEEEIYQKVLEYVKNEDDWNKESDYAYDNFKARLGSVSSQNGKITHIGLFINDDKLSENLYSTKDGLGMFVTFNKVTHQVYKVLLRYSKKNCICYSNEIVYERYNEIDTETINELFTDIYNFIESDLKDVRSHYNNEIKKLKQEYKQDLLKRKQGLTFLKENMKKE